MEKPWNPTISWSQKPIINTLEVLFHKVSYKAHDFLKVSTTAATTTTTAIKKTNIYDHSLCIGLL